MILEIPRYFGHFRGFMGILLILEILGIILDLQGYIGNFGSVGVSVSFQVFKGILVISEIKRVFK